MTALRRFAESPAGDPSTPKEVAAPLRRFLQPREGPAPGEVCEFCAEMLTDDHRHVVDIEGRALKCACRGCGLLFTEAGAGGGRYRTVPDRYAELAGFTLEPQRWAALQIPVGMAFFLANSKLGRITAFYPSPGGATESELPLDAWEGIVADNPALAEVEPDVEAVLVRTAERSNRGIRPPDDAVGGASCHIVPVDRCYELVGELRLHWRGFDGGQEVRERMGAFFSDVERRSRPIGRPAETPS